MYRFAANGVRGISALHVSPGGSTRLRSSSYGGPSNQGGAGSRREPAADPQAVQEAGEQLPFWYGTQVMSTRSRVVVRMIALAVVLVAAVLIVGALGLSGWPRRLVFVGAVSIGVFAVYAIDHFRERRRPG